MSVLLCDLSSLVTHVSFVRVHAALTRANGGWLAVAEPDELRDEAYDAFTAGQIGEHEFTLHLRARLGWRGSDPGLLSIMADSYGSVDVAVMELLVELRERGWYLVGLLEPPASADPMRRARWGGQFAEQLTVFHQVHKIVDHPRTDPRFFADVLRIVGGHGPRLYIDARAENVAAARRSGLDAHLFSGASGLRSACGSLMVGV